MNIPTIGDRGPSTPTPGQRASGRTQQTHAEIFHKIKKRTGEDRTHKKIKLKNVRVFDDKITKKETATPIEKENRSLNVAARLRALSSVLSNEGFTRDQVHLISGEYKAKLKEEGQVTNAVSFVDYVIAKQSSKLTLKQNVLIDKLADLRENHVFEQLDNAFVFRHAGVEKAVYCFETMAVLTARQASSAKALETEYEMTVDLRVSFSTFASLRLGVFALNFFLLLICKINIVRECSVEDQDKARRAR